MQHSQLIRINDVTVAIKHLLKVALDEQANRVLVFVKDRTDTFKFQEDSLERATSLYIDLCNLIRTTQQEIPFLFLSNIAIKLETITSIHLEPTQFQIIVSLIDQSPETFNFQDKKSAKEAFDSLMASMGMGKPAEQSEEAKETIKPNKNKKENRNEKEIKKSPPKKTQTKAPIKSSKKPK